MIRARSYSRASTRRLARREPLAIDELLGRDGGVLRRGLRGVSVGHRLLFDGRLAHGFRQRVPERRRVAKAFARIHGERAPEGALDAVGRGDTDRAERRPERRIGGFLEDGEEVIARERALPRHDLDEHEREREHVRPRPARAATLLELLGRRIPRAEHGHAARLRVVSGGRVIQDLRDPEVEDLQRRAIAFADDHEVLGFDVAVRDLFGVRDREGRSRRAEETERRAEGSPRPPRAAPRSEIVGERTAFEPLEDEERHLDARAGVTWVPTSRAWTMPAVRCERRSSIRPSSRSCATRSRWAAAPRPDGSSRRPTIRDGRVEPLVCRAVHHAEPAFAHEPIDEVLTPDPLADEEPNASSASFATVEIYTGRARRAEPKCVDPAARRPSPPRRTTPLAQSGDREGAILGRNRVLRQAQAACAVDHPAIVPVHDVIETEDGESALVMDLLEGESLEACLGSPGRWAMVSPHASSSRSPRP